MRYTVTDPAKKQLRRKPYEPTCVAIQAVA